MSASTDAPPPHTHGSNSLVVAVQEACPARSLMAGGQLRLRVRVQGKARHTGREGLAGANIGTCVHSSWASCRPSAGAGRQLARCNGRPQGACLCSAWCRTCRQAACSEQRAQMPFSRPLEPHGRGPRTTRRPVSNLPDGRQAMLVVPRRRLTVGLHREWGLEMVPDAEHQAEARHRHRHAQQQHGHHADRHPRPDVRAHVALLVHVARPVAVLGSRLRLRACARAGEIEAWIALAGCWHAMRAAAAAARRTWVAADGQAWIRRGRSQELCLIHPAVLHTSITQYSVF